VFLGEYELGVAEQEPPGGAVAQHVGRPGLGGRIARRVRALQVLGFMARSGLRGGPCYGFQRELNDLAAVHLFALSDTEAEFSVGEVLVQ
jgi:hypothetical protein